MAAWNAEIEKDRRSRMAQSTINAPIKKDGAGGQYTWGAPMDVRDYEPMGTVAPPSGVFVAQAQPVASMMAPAQAFSNNLTDRSQFPSLGGQVRTVTSAPPTALPGQQYWPASAAPRVQLTEDVNRAGSAQLFDSTHPRNQFAVKPHTASGVVPQAAGQPQMIDWSQQGIPQEVKTQIIRGSANPAHLSPYAQPRAAQSMTTFQPPQQQVAQNMYKPQMQPIMKMPNGRMR